MSEVTRDGQLAGSQEHSPGKHRLDDSAWALKFNLAHASEFINPWDTDSLQLTHKRWRHQLTKRNRNTRCGADRHILSLLGKLLKEVSHSQEVQDEHGVT